MIVGIELAQGRILSMEMVTNFSFRLYNLEKFVMQGMMDVYMKNLGWSCTSFVMIVKFIMVQIH